MLNIVIPLAGRGSRFISAGYEDPKPFIDVAGKPMIHRVVENLMPLEPHRFIFLARRDHESYIRQHMSFATNVIYVDEVTEGAACTVLLAEKLINNKNPLIIANSDQLVEWNNATKPCSVSHPKHYSQMVWREINNIQDMINAARHANYDASIAAFYASHPKWSYARLNSDMTVAEVAEKKVISNFATVGIYYYKTGENFVENTYAMIHKDIRVNGEFYVCPIFNEMIKNDRASIGLYMVHKMMGLGTPEDLEKYLNEGQK